VTRGEAPRSPCVRERAWARGEGRPQRVYGYRAMAVIGDSSAVRLEGRQLAQHQAALTLLQRLLSAPGVRRLTWLDLACGRGQIIGALRENLSDDARAKIEFSAYDVKHDYLLETRKIAEALGFATVCGHVGDLSHFDQVLPSEQRFDFITLTNTVHEVAAERLADVLVDAIRRLDDHGTIFLYDMERIKPPELGALPFSADDFRAVAHALVQALSDKEYRPEVSRWEHTSVNGWNVQIQREYISATEHELEMRRARAVTDTRDAILLVLRRRLTECRATLEKLTIYDAETAEEQEDREHLLHELWAITRALEASK
jgi:SAM-dependent methyltransferase